LGGLSILDCDLFTREYLEEELGREVTPLEMPIDEDETQSFYSNSKKFKAPTQRSLLKARQQADFASFLNCDKMVLRYYVACDDTLSVLYQSRNNGSF